MFNITKSEIKDYLTGIDKFPSYKIDEFLFVHKHQDLTKEFKSIESKQQIKALLKISSSHASTYNRYSGLNIECDLIEVLSKFQDKTYCNNIRERLYKPFKDDDEIYNFLRKLRDLTWKQKKSKRSLVHPKFLPNAGELVAQNIGYELKEFHFSNYMDLGAGSGYKTKLIAQKLGIDLKKVYAIDYEKFDDKAYNREKEINFSNLDSKMTILPYGDQTFDLVSALMVLHHITDEKVLDFTLQQVNRVVKLGGYFLLKEHNCMNVSDFMINDIEHCMYELVYNKIANYDFRKINYSHYYSWVEWDIIMKKYGFEKVKMFNVDYSVSNKINASKHWMGLYKKK